MNTKKLTQSEENMKYLKLIGMSIAAEYLANKTVLKVLPGGLVTKEFLENFISKKIAKEGNLELNSTDQAIGALPICGVTAVTVHCIRQLLDNILEEKPKVILRKNGIDKVIQE